MKTKRMLLGAFALVASTALLTTEVVSARQDARPEDAAFSRDEMMAKMMELATPGPEHAELAKLVGKWTQSYRMKWDPTATEWDESTGTSEAKTILDGRFVVQTYEFYTKEGPMKGYNILGFDKMKGEHTSLWADTWSTWWTSTAGKEIAPGKVELRGTMRGETGDMPTRSVVEHKSADEITFRMYCTYPGLGEQLAMEYTSKRAK